MGFFNKISSIFKKRDHSVVDVMHMFYNYLNPLVENGTFEWPSIVGHYMSESGTYIVMSDSGKLYRSDITLSGSEVSFSTPSPVEVHFVGLGGKMRIVGRDSKGRPKFVVFAASSVLNRDGEIDSRDLFDSFENTFDIEERPVVTIRHIHSPEFYFGEVLGAYRLENMLICHGVLEPEHPLTKYAVERFGDPEWGISIGFYAEDYQNDKTEEGIAIPVYKKGRLIEISVLREKEAASHLTGTKIIKDGVDRMGKTKEQVQKILLDFTNDEAFVQQFLEEAEIRERKIQEDGLITRNSGPEEEVEETEEVAVDPEVEAEEADVEDTEAEEPVVVEIDITDEALAQAISQSLDEKLTDVREQLKSFAGAVDTLTGVLQTLQEGQDTLKAEIEERFSKIEKEDVEKVQEIVEDLPLNRRKINTVVYRPSLQREVDSPQDGKPDIAAIRKETLNKRMKNIVK